MLTAAGVIDDQVVEAVESLQGALRHSGGIALVPTTAPVPPAHLYYSIKGRLDMRGMIAVLLLLSALFLSVQSIANASNTIEADLNWQLATTFVNGDPLPPGYLTATEVCWSLDDDSLSNCFIVPVGDGTDHFLAVEVTPRSEPYVLNVALKSVGADGQKSVFSEIKTKTFDVSLLAPSPPHGVTFGIRCLEAGCDLRIVTP